MDGDELRDVAARAEVRRSPVQALIDAWPLTLGVVVLVCLLAGGALALLGRHGRQEAASAPAAAALPAAPAVAEAPAALPNALDASGTAPPAAAPSAPDDAGPLTPAQQLAELPGDWMAEDAQTRSLTRMTIRREGGDWFTRVYGRCHPDDCDWGTASAVADPDTDAPQVTLSAQYEPGFATQALTLHVVRRGLIAYRVETDFTDGSGRGHQVSEGLLRRR